MPNPSGLLAHYGDTTTWEGNLLRLTTVGEAAQRLSLSAQHVRNLTVTTDPKEHELYPVAVATHGERVRYLYQPSTVERVARVRERRKVDRRQLWIGMGPKGFK